MIEFRQSLFKSRARFLPCESRSLFIRWLGGNKRRPLPMVDCFVWLWSMERRMDGR